LRKGRLITFEGGEGSGKTTQIRRSHLWLTSHLSHLLPDQPSLDLVITREPGGTDRGQAIRQVLLNPDVAEPMNERAELLLYASDRAQHVEFLLKPALNRGAIVLSDRYIDSTIAYQGYGRKLDLDLIHQINQIATGGLESDLTLWFDVAPEVGLTRTHRRGTADRMEQNQLDFHQRVHQGFAAIAQAHPHRVVRIDANCSEEEVARQVQEVLQRSLMEWYLK
jgi:dTMP kinase